MSTLLEKRLALGTLPGASLLIGFDHPEQIARAAFTQVNGHKFCGECRLCRRVLADAHPEFMSSSDDSIEEARRLVNLANRRTSELDTRVIAIIGPRRQDFQNSLLKLLEEPGPTRILWFAKDTTPFLDTVLSRAELFRGPDTAESRVDPESMARAIEFIDVSRRRNLLLISTLPDIWEDPAAVIQECARLLLEEAVETGNLWPYDAAVAVHRAIRFGRPAGNSVKYLADAIIGG